MEQWPDSPATETGRPGVHIEFLPGPLDPNEGRRRLRSGELGGLIILPAGLSQRLAKDQEAKVQLLVGPGPGPERSGLEAAVDRLVSRVRERKPAPLSWQSAEGNEARRATGFNSFAQAVAGTGVLFILLNCIITGGMGLVYERRRNTLDRLLISPLSRGTIILGKALGVYLVGLLQATLIFGFGLVAGVALGDLAGVVLVTLVFILVGCALGLMISALARSEEAVQMVGGPVSTVMTALGGGLFPFGMAPAWMQKVALLFPTGWAMQAYHKLMWEGKDFNAVLPNLLVLSGFAAVFLVVGVRCLRWE
jgi:ABC-type multidrug transport system permease subunit